MGRFFLIFLEILLTYPSFFKHSAIAFFILEYGREMDSFPARFAFFNIIIMFEIESIPLEIGRVRLRYVSSLIIYNIFYNFHNYFYFYASAISNGIHFFTKKTSL